MGFKYWQVRHNLDGYLLMLVGLLDAGSTDDLNCESRQQMSPANMIFIDSILQLYLLPGTSCSSMLFSI
jgi:hypothetical protein